MILAFDALVLVHWDYAVPPDRSYERGILEALRACSDGTPVFVVPHTSRSRWRSDPIRRALRDVGAYRVPHVAAQYEVDFVARRIRAPVPDARLGFGGMWADACVYGKARSWCESLDTRWVDGGFCGDVARRRFGYGEILESIVLP